MKSEVENIDTALRDEETALILGTIDRRSFVSKAVLAGFTVSAALAITERATAIQTGQAVKAQNLMAQYCLPSAPMAQI